MPTNTQENTELESSQEQSTLTPESEQNTEQTTPTAPSEQTTTPSEQDTSAQATNIAYRQEILDKLTELAQSAENAEALCYIIKAYTELNTDRLERVATAKAALLKRAKALQASAKVGRDAYMLAKYTQSLGENPPTTPHISFSHTELLKKASGVLTITPSHSDTHGSNLTYEILLSNLAATATQNLQAGAHTLTAIDAARDTQASIKARAISPSGAVSEWSAPIQVAIKTSIYAGFIENIDTNKSKRINTGTQEDNLWLDKVESRLNENSNDDPVTKFFDRDDMPHSHIKRYALKNDGTLEPIPSDATKASEQIQKYLDNATYQCVSKIPEHHLIDIEFIHNNQSFMLKLVSLSPFTYDLNKAGYQGYTNLEGRGDDESGIISSVKVEGFYLGSWEGVLLGGMGGSFFLNNEATKPAGNETRAAFRSKVQSFNPNTKIQNHHEREALAFLYCIERGYLGSTADLKTTDQSKWAIYCWKTNSDTANDLSPAIAYDFSNQTKAIPVSTSDKRAKMFIYRGICNPAGNIWEFADGAFLKDRLLYLATHEQDYSDTTSPTHYQNTGRVLSQVQNDQHTKRVFAGTMIPKSTSGGTSTNGTTDIAWIADGERSLLVGGSLINHSGSGILTWCGDSLLSGTAWWIGFRSCFKPPRL